ncbi:MAG: glutaredoxin family protein [Cyclobacteriaceae bacterium]
MVVKVYGADWCTKTGFLKNYLQSEWVDFDFFNVELDEAAANYIRSLFEGKLKFPVVTVDEQVLLNPKISELRKAITP